MLNFKNILENDATKKISFNPLKFTQSSVPELKIQQQPSRTLEKLNLIFKFQKLTRVEMYFQFNF